MIFSSIKSRDDRQAYPAAIRKAIEFVEHTDIAALAPGDYPIDGDRIYAKIFDLTTLPVEQTHPEVHIDHCDVQFWVAGREQFGIAPYLGGGKVIEAREGDDTYFLESVPNESFVTATPGCFAVFFPWDAHRPGVMLDGQTTFRKCVVKVRVEMMKGMA